MINPLSILPPDIFPPDMQPIIYFTILPVIIGVLLFGYLVLYLYAPKTSKLYFFNKMKKHPIVDFETDEGVRGQETIKTYSEGVCFGTKTGTPYIFPRPISNELILYRMEPELKELEEKLKAENKTKPAKDQLSKEQIIDKLRERVSEEIKAVRKMEGTTLRPSVDNDLGVPVYRAYRSRVNATTLVHMLGLGQDGDDKQTLFAIPMVKKTGKRCEAVELNLGKDKNTDEWIMNVYLPVDPKVLKKWVPDMWTPSQLTASNLISEEIGRQKNEGLMKKYLILFIVFGAVLALFFVAVLIGTG